MPQVFLFSRNTTGAGEAKLRGHNEIAHFMLKIRFLLHLIITHGYVQGRYNALTEENQLSSLSPFHLSSPAFTHSLYSPSIQLVTTCLKKLVHHTSIQLFILLTGGSENFQDKRKYFYNEVRKLTKSPRKEQVIKVRRSKILDDVSKSFQMK